MIVSKPCVTMKGIVISSYSWERPVKVNLRKTAECLKVRGHAVKKLIPGMMLIVEIENYEVSVYPSGKIIIKLLDDAKKGAELARAVYDCAGIPEVVS